MACSAIQGLLQFSALRLVTVSRDVHLHAAVLASTLRLRGADSIYVAVADRLRVPLVTWDREHRRRLWCTNRVERLFIPDDLMA